MLSLLEKELALLENSSQQAFPPESIIPILQRCRKEKIHVLAHRFHACIRRMGLETNISLGPHLLLMLVDVGNMQDAQCIFDTLPHKKEDLWNSLITGYAKQGGLQRAIAHYQKMQEESVHPSSHTFVPLLNACAKLKDAKRGQEMHLEVSRKGLETNIHVGCTLVDMYVKCDLMSKAQEVFDELPARNVVAWNSLISGYSRLGFGKEALNCYEQMRVDGISPTAITYVCILKACGSLGALDMGTYVHSQISTKNMEGDLYVGSALVDMYANLGLLMKARDAFEKLTARDIVSWTSLIGGYSKHGHGAEALNCFKQMQLEGMSPNTYTFVCSLKACSCIGAVTDGEQLHASIAAEDSDRNLFVGSALVDMYANNGFVMEAQEVFENLPKRDIVSWNALITGFVKHGYSKEALKGYERLKVEHFLPNKVTFLSSLKACGIVGDFEKGREIHADIDRSGLTIDLVVGSALVDMYGKFGFLTKAQEIFDSILSQTKVSWNALITGYTKHGAAQEALNCFEKMQHDNVSPDLATFVSCLKACSQLGASEKGQELHAAITSEGLEKDVFIGSALIDMYCNCGILSRAQEVFDNHVIRDSVTWNALLAGYAQLGESEKVFSILTGMLEEGQRPSMVTFVSVLNACSHAGLVDEGNMYMVKLSQNYGMLPSLEHHNCAVDLLGRAGQFNRAMLCIESMPFLPNIVVWHTILSACRKWSNVQLGTHIFEHALELDDKDLSTYFYMSNIFLDAGTQEDAEIMQA